MNTTIENTESTTTEAQDGSQEPVQEPAGIDVPTAPETPQEPAEDAAEEAAEPESKAGRDAARYRHQLRETETERDTLRDRVGALQRALVEARLRTSTVSSELFWKLHPEIDDLLTDDGAIDVDLLDKAATDVHHLVNLPGEYYSEPPSPKGLLGPYVPTAGQNPTNPLATRPFRDAFDQNHYHDQY